MYANVISKYGNLIKNSTRWVYTSLESYRQQQFQEDLLVGEHDSITIYPNWHGCQKGFFKLDKMGECKGSGTLIKVPVRKLTCNIINLMRD